MQFPGFQPQAWQLPVYGDSPTSLPRMTESGKEPREIVSSSKGCRESLSLSFGLWEGRGGFPGRFFGSFFRAGYGLTSRASLLLLTAIPSLAPSRHGPGIANCSRLRVPNICSTTQTAKLHTLCKPQSGNSVNSMFACRLHIGLPASG